jgi:hypothetical protein
MSEALESLVDRYSMLEDDWLVEAGAFTSPLVKELGGQMLLFGNRFRNGSISADVTILECHKDGLGYCYWQWGLLARQQGDKQAGSQNFEQALAIFTELKMPSERDAVQAELDKTDAA